VVITVRRSFPWFPLALAIAWLWVMGLALRDLAWFANVSASFADEPRPAAAATQARTAEPLQMRSGVATCPASVIAPVARAIH
jgi:hypothetical protein